MRAHSTDAGYDVFANADVEIDSSCRALVPIGISIEPPEGCYTRVAPRSGLSVKGIDIGAGVVDRGYTGELKVLVINNTKSWYCVHKGDKIAQLIIERHETPNIELVHELGESERGEGGFGHTGD